jgi:hypothetical protein
MKNLREYECDDAKFLTSEAAFKKDPANQQQFCFSRDFDSKRGARVCLSGIWILILGSFLGVSLRWQSLTPKIASGFKMRTELLPLLGYAAFAKSW